MKKKATIILSILFGLLIISGLLIAMIERDPREIVWNKLSNEEMKHLKIIGTWSDAKLEKIIVDGSFHISVPEYYSGKELYRITFNTGDPILGSIIVYVDPVTKKIVNLEPRA